MATMKTTLAVACFAAALAGGCYQSDVPLDPAPAVDLEEQWLGTWRCLPFNADADEEPATVRIKRGPERRYALTWQEDGGKQVRYEAFASDIDRARLWNFREVKTDGTTGASSWMFVRPTLLRPGVLQAQVVDEDALKNVEASPAAVRRAISRRLSQSALFVDFCVCVRAKEPSEPTPAP